MNPFSDITLINADDTPIIAEQKRQMNGSNIIMLNRIYEDGLQCICGKNIKIMYKHIESSKHKRFCKKHNINIEIIKPEVKPKKEKKPKTNIIGRPKIYIDDTPEKARERNRLYMLNYLDSNDDKRENHNRRVAEYRAKNRELCRERVRRCRAKKKEIAKSKLEGLYKGTEVSS
jgi:hypothetical protein